MTNELNRRTMIAAFGASAAAGAALGLGRVSLAESPRSLVGSMHNDALPLGTPILVMIDLMGGNDSLNTVVPVDDPWYRDPDVGRTTLALSAADTLDMLGTPYRWHKSLRWLADRWNKTGDVAVVLGSGDVQARERSHFAAMDIRNRTSYDLSERTGWLGRVNQALDPESGITGISLDGAHPALAETDNHGLSVYDVNNFGYINHPHAGRDFNAALEAMVAEGENSLANVAAREMAHAISAGPVVSKAASRYRSNGAPGGIIWQLLQAVRMINNGIGGRTYVATHGSFDTHDYQEYFHGPLLRELDTALMQFFKLLAFGPRANDVFVMIQSEFGRQVTENGGQGTDHGLGGMHILLGTGVMGGLYGVEPDLDPAAREGDAIVPSVDFRSVHADVVQRLTNSNATTNAVLGGNFAPVGVF